MTLRALGWLVADTFRQSLWSGVFWLMLTATGLCVAFGLTARIREPQPGAPGQLSYLFGAVREPTTHDRDYHARQLLLAFGVGGANTLGLLLAVAATAGFIPGFVDPNSALILLAKPVRRWQMLAGKFLGVLAFFTVHALIFVVGTWVAVGIATGVWPSEYLWTLPLAVLNFAMFFSFSTMLAVTTRSTVACVFGTLMFWLVCWLSNLGRHALHTYDLSQFTAASRVMSEACYWLLPKPADVNIVLYDLLNPDPFRELLGDFAKVQDRGAFHAGLSIVASLAFPVLVLAVSGYELETADY
jgi:ABC-type transport system involved in multi-copper enzyme maturation permease subunit